METTSNSPELEQRARRLEYATIAWNVGEAVLTIGLGIAAASLALIGFGADSVVEIFASAVVVWHLVPTGRDERPGRTRRALRLTAVAFLGLAVVLIVAAIADLAGGRRAGDSPWGIAYLTVTAFVMFGLAVAKRRTAARLGSAPLRSEARLTLLDAMLATATMIGLTLNAAVGWWWADPAAALVVALVAMGEARNTWTEADGMVRQPTGDVGSNSVRAP